MYPLFSKKMFNYLNKVFGILKYLLNKTATVSRAARMTPLFFKTDPPSVM